MAEITNRASSTAGALLVVLVAAVLIVAMFASQVGGIVKTMELPVRHRHDDHIAARHGVRGLTAVTALKLCSPLEVWWCPSDTIRPETYVALCREKATDRCAVGVVSATPRSDGRYVLLTAYIAVSYRAETARLSRRLCAPVAGIELQWP